MILPKSRVFVKIFATLVCIAIVAISIPIGSTLWYDFGPHPQVRKFLLPGEYNIELNPDDYTGWIFTNWKSKGVDAPDEFDREIKIIDLVEKRPIDLNHITYDVFHKSHADRSGRQEFVFTIDKKGMYRVSDPSGAGATRFVLIIAPSKLQSCGLGSTETLPALYNDFYFEKPARIETSRVVCATRDIPIGATIPSDAVAEKDADKSLIPARVVASSELASHGHPASFYLTSTSDAIGRVSKGIRKGDVLYFSYPGFRGCTVIFSVRDVPEGTIIKSDSVVEKEINPCDIPIRAASSLKEVVGKYSTGIRKGQVITDEEGNFGRNGMGGDFPGFDSASVAPACVYALKDIAAGSVIRPADIRHSSSRFSQSVKADNLRYAMFPEGRQAKRILSAGKIIMQEDVK